MKKKTLLTILLIVLILAAGAGYVAYRLAIRGTDIIGVTTLVERNVIIMNSKTGDEFTSGSGTITVGEGEHLHLEYNLDAGTLDIACNAGSGSLDIFQDADLGNLPSEGEVFGRSALEGKGSLDLKAAEGSYTVYFNPHSAIGRVTVSTAK